MGLISEAYKATKNQKFCVDCKHYLSVGAECQVCTEYSSHTPIPSNTNLPIVGITGPVGPVMSVPTGTKHDSGKRDWTLLPWKQLEQVVQVLEFGATKYSRDNWKQVERDRYEKALMRHTISYLSGEKQDPESQQSHLAHVICNCLFLLYNDGK